MKNPDNYKVFCSGSLDTLEALVKGAIEGGMIPCGGVAISNWSMPQENFETTAHSEYCQAMVAPSALVNPAMFKSLQALILKLQKRTS